MCNWFIQMALDRQQPGDTPVNDSSCETGPIAPKELVETVILLVDVRIHR